MGDDVAEAARKHREREAAATAKQQDARDPKRKPKHDEAMLTDALAGRGGETLEKLAAMVALLIAGGIGALLDAWLGSLGIAIGVALMLGLMLVAFTSTERLVAGAARRELKRLRGFDHRTYLEQLTLNRSSGTAVFTVTFKKHSDKSQVCDAVKEWMKELVSVKFAGEKLVAKTDSVSCHQMVEGSVGNGIQHEWTNRDLHTQVAHFIRRVLPHLDYAKLEIEIEGKTEPWDQKA